MNFLVLKTGGQWENTSLFANNEEVAAVQLFVQIMARRNEYGEPMRGGISANGCVGEVWARLQSEPEVQTAVFPGRLEMNFPGHQVIVENTHPNFAEEFTRVWYNGREETQNVVDVYVNLDYDENILEGNILLYQAHWIAQDEVINIPLI